LMEQRILEPLGTRTITRRIWLFRGQRVSSAPV